MTRSVRCGLGEEGFPLRLANGMIIHGWALVARREGENGLVGAWLTQGTVLHPDAAGRLLAASARWRTAHTHATNIDAPTGEEREMMQDLVSLPADWGVGMSPRGMGVAHAGR
jgi:hypothetical protein